MSSWIGTVMSPGRNWGGASEFGTHMSQAHFRLAVNLTSAGRRAPRLLSARGPGAGPSSKRHWASWSKSPVTSRRPPSALLSQHPTPTYHLHRQTTPSQTSPPGHQKKTSHQLCVSTPLSRLRRRRILLRSLSTALRLSLPPTSTPLSTTASFPRLRRLRTSSCATTIQGDQGAAGNTVGRPISWPDQRFEPSLTAGPLSRAGTRSSRSYTCAPLCVFYVCLDFVRRRQ